MLPAIESILEYHGFAKGPPGSHVDWVVSIELGGPRPSVPATADAHVDAETGLAVFRRGRLLFIVGDEVVAVVSDDEKLNLWLSEDIARDEATLSLVLYFVLTFALLGLLQKRAMFAVHGAALGLDESNGLLLIGESDTGKSTLSMTLVRAGWCYLSDDSFFLRQEGDGPVDAIPFRRHFGLDPDAVAIFPELQGTADTQLVDKEKRRLSVVDFYPSQFIERCTPRVIVFPTVAPSKPSTIEAIRPTDALRRLMTQTSFVDMDASLTRRQMDVLQRGIRQSRCYALAAGTDLKGNPGAADSLFRPLFRGLQT